MRNAQATQVYVIIGVVFFFGVVLGFKLIYDFIETSSDLRLAEFEIRLKSDVEATSVKPGTVTKFSYVLPYQTDKLCFHDKSAASSGLMPDNPTFKSMVEEGKNVFLIGGFKVRSVKVENIHAPLDFYCVNVSHNMVSLALEGKESTTLVRRPD